jgi:hypothetical protein
MPLLNKFRNEGSFGALTEVHFPKAVQFSKTITTLRRMVGGLPDKCHTKTPIVFRGQLSISHITGSLDPIVRYPVCENLESSSHSGLIEACGRELQTDRIGGTDLQASFLGAKLRIVGI